jgi:protein TonB
VLRLLLGCLAASLLIGFVLCFGRLIFFWIDEPDSRAIQQVELLAVDDTVSEKDKKDEKEKPQEKPPDEQQVEEEPPPDSAELVRNLEISEVTSAPELEAASLSAIEAALSGQLGGSSDFAETLSLASGGRIGGTAKAGAGGDELESAFSMAEIDQKPRAIFQSSPPYPAELRSKKLEGVVTVIFVVDSTGKVANPSVQSSSNTAFDKPALDAVKKWKFEPAIKGGERVACKMRVPIRFKPS